MAECFRAGSVPVLVGQQEGGSNATRLPFSDVIDWDLAVVRVNGRELKVKFGFNCTEENCEFAFF